MSTRNARADPGAAPGDDRGNDTGLGPVWNAADGAPDVLGVVGLRGETARRVGSKASGKRAAAAPKPGWRRGRHVHAGRQPGAAIGRRRPTARAGTARVSQRHGARRTAAPWSWKNAGSGGGVWPGRGLVRVGDRRRRQRRARQSAGGAPGPADAAANRFRPARVLRRRPRAAHELAQPRGVRRAPQRGVVGVRIADEQVGAPSVPGNRGASERQQGDAAVTAGLRRSRARPAPPKRTQRSDSADHSRRSGRCSRVDLPAYAGPQDGHAALAPRAGSRLLAPPASRLSGAGRIARSCRDPVPARRVSRSLRRGGIVLCRLALRHLPDARRRRHRRSPPRGGARA